MCFQFSKLIIISEVAACQLNEDEGQSNPSSFDEQPPPAPKLHSQGVVAMDNTQQFQNAAQSRSSSNLPKLRIHADNKQTLTLANSSKMNISPLKTLLVP
jgi:hypothetical protein